MPPLALPGRIRCLAATLAASRAARARYTIGRLMLVIAALAVALAWLPWPLALVLGPFALLALGLAKLGARPVEVVVVLALALVAACLWLLAYRPGRAGPAGTPAATSIFRGTVGPGTGRGG